MEMVVTVTLLKDSDGQYSLNLNKPTVTVSPLYEDSGDFDTVNVRWLLREDEAHPNFPNNAKQLTVTFNTLPTPFTLTSDAGLPSTEVYVVGALLRNVTTSTSRNAGRSGSTGSTGVTPWKTRASSTSAASQGSASVKAPSGRPSSAWMVVVPLPMLRRLISSTST